MKINIITITGYSCSGKSTLINEIRKQYNCDIIKFGEIHKECVKNNGYLYAKDWISEKGFRSYENQLLLTFKKQLLSLDIDCLDSNNIIIDGIFSDKCFKLLRSVSRINLTNIVLNTNYQNRISRMIERQHMNYEEAVKHMYTTDSIKQEAGLPNILNDFDYIIDGNKTIEEIRERCALILKGLDVQKNKNIEKKQQIDLR